MASSSFWSWNRRRRKYLCQRSSRHKIPWYSVSGSSSSIKIKWFQTKKNDSCHFCPRWRNRRNSRRERIRQNRSFQKNEYRIRNWWRYSSSLSQLLLRELRAKNHLAYSHNLHWAKWSWRIFGGQYSSWKNVHHHG